MVSSLALGEQDKVVVVFVAGIATEVAIGGKVNLAADNGLYPCLYGCQVELNGAIHSAMVSYG